MAVKQKVVECVGSTAPELQLQMILRALQDLTGQGLEDQMCGNIVISLGRIYVPTKLNDYIQFIENIKRLQEILAKECTKDNLIFVMLKTLYREISTAEKPLSPVMSIVLQLIDSKQLQRAVDFIIQIGSARNNLKRALQTLCSWLSKWILTENLGPLILIFMQGLEAQQQYDDILDEIILQNIESLFFRLILPDSRKSLEPLVLYMLSHAQNNPEPLNKILGQVMPVVNLLFKEDSESSLGSLREVVKVLIALMERFSEFDNRYVPYKKALEPYYPEHNQKMIGGRSMLQSNSIVTMYSTSGKVGLNNLGNTCYMNSVLQALFMTKPFRNEVLLHAQEMTPLLTKLQSLFALLQHSKRTSLSPSDLSNLARPPGFLPGHQHDSSEFLGHLLDTLHEQEKTAGPESQTIIQSAFGGRTLSVSECGRCHTKSQRNDNFRELQLSFPPNSENNMSVQNLLDYYVQPEKLSGENQYHCDVCDCLTDGERFTIIEEAPPRLILTLKHFRYDPASQQRTKLLQSVKLDKHVTLEAGQYELYAAVVHCGFSVDSGHYYTFAKDADEWFKFNDCFVTRTVAEELCSLKPPETAYILFYSREDCVDPQPLHRVHLSTRLQLLISDEHTKFEQENRGLSVRTFTSGDSNRKDEPPPPGCGGSGFSTSSSNMFVC